MGNTLAPPLLLERFLRVLRIWENRPASVRRHRLGLLLRAFFTRCGLTRDIDDRDLVVGPDERLGVTAFLRNERLMVAG